MIKLPARIKLENDILYVTVFGKKINEILISKIELIAIKKLNKSIFFWLLSIISTILLFLILHQYLDITLLLILSPFIVIMISKIFNTIYNNSILIKQFEKEPIEYVIVNRQKHKVKSIVAKIRREKNLNSIKM